jgi:hypothetical protein
VRDDKTQIQALDRTEMSLPLFPGRLKTMTHEYNRATRLFASIELASKRLSEIVRLDSQSGRVPHKFREGRSTR